MLLLIVTGIINDQVDIEPPVSSPCFPCANDSYLFQSTTACIFRYHELSLGVLEK